MELLEGMLTSCGEGNISWFPKRQETLTELIKENKPKILIETGFNMGHSALIICKTISEIKMTDTEYQNENIDFYIFDICEHDCVKPNFEVLKNHFKGIINLHLIEGSSFETLKVFNQIYNNPIDFAEIDGCHTYEGVQNDVNNVLNVMNDNGIIYIDDYKSTEFNIWGVDKGVDDLDWSGFVTNEIDGLFWAKKTNTFENKKPIEITKTKVKIRAHNPCNEHTRYYRYYNYFWDKFTDFLKLFFDVEENRYFENAHKERYHVKLEKGISDNFCMLECEYIIENLETGEFSIMSISDLLTHAILNEQSNPYLNKVLVSQFKPKEIKNHTLDNFNKYSPWTYFQSCVIDLEMFYNKRQILKPTNNKLYFRGTSLEDRKILNYFDKNIITDILPIPQESYFNEIINHKIALSLDGRGEFCYRDIECFAVGVPIIRFEFESKFNSNLIPNYHYISLNRPSDMLSYRLGSEEHAKMIEDRYHEVINDDEFLNFISKNARKYYEDNCEINRNIKNTFNLLGLNNWL